MVFWGWRKLKNLDLSNYVSLSTFNSFKNETNLRLDELSNSITNINNTINTLQTDITNISNNFSNYYTKTEVDDIISNIDTNGGIDNTILSKPLISLSNVENYTDVEILPSLNSTQKNIYFRAYNQKDNDYLLKTNFYNTKYINDNYYTKTEVDNLGSSEWIDCVKNDIYYVLGNSSEELSKYKSLKIKIKYYITYDNRNYPNYETIVIIPINSGSSTTGENYFISYVNAGNNDKSVNLNRVRIAGRDINNKYLLSIENIFALSGDIAILNIIGVSYIGE